jgi:hypothetical protein
MTKQYASTIQYLNVASHLSRTQSLLTELIKDKVHSKFLVITSSIERADELCKFLDNTNCWIIHQESATYVAPCIMETIEEINENGNGVIVTTVEDFSYLPVFEDQQSWILITDQALEQVDSFDRSSFCNQAVLTDYLEVEQQTHWNQYQLKLKEKDSMRYIDTAHGNFDLLVQQFRNYNCFTIKRSWDNIAGKYFWDWDDEVQVVSILKLEFLAGFHQVILLEEDFTESLFYNYYSKYSGVAFEGHEGIS